MRSRREMRASEMAARPSNRGRRAHPENPLAEPACEVALECLMQAARAIPSRPRQAQEDVRHRSDQTSRSDRVLHANDRGRVPEPWSVDYTLLSIRFRAAGGVPCLLGQRDESLAVRAAICNDRLRIKELELALERARGSNLLPSARMPVNFYGHNAIP